MDDRVDQRPGELTACPKCDAPFYLGQAVLDGRWLCVACRAEVSGTDPSAPLRWLYPLGPASFGGDSKLESGFATWATQTGAGAADVGGDAPSTHIDRYVLLGELGAGGMGVVYRAHDPELRRTVALKVLTAGRFASTSALARFIGEARIAAALDHPGIVRVHDLGTVDGRPFFTMEQVLGPSLDATIRAHGPLMMSEVARIGELLAQAVQHAHSAGVVHRDLKPANILLTCQGTPRITDFGLAKPLGSDAGLTATQNMLGTPAYIAPEVARGERDIDWRAVDVYGLGVLLYAMLTGSPPSRGATVAQTLEAAASGRRAPLRSLRPEVPAALEAIVLHALYSDPGRRYRSAGALADDLRRFRAGEPVWARPEGVSERAVRWLRRQQRALVVVSVVGLLVSAAIGVPAWQEHRQALAREAAAAAALDDVAARARAEAADGHHDGAAALLDAFVGAPQHQGTVALAEALLLRGELMPTSASSWHGEVDVRPLAPWADALRLAPTDAVRAQVLLRFARWQADRNRFATMAPMIETLEAFGGPSIEAESLPLRLQWAAATGRPEEAIAAWDRAAAQGLPIATEYADPRRAQALLSRGSEVFTLPNWKVITAGTLPDGSPALIFHAAPPRVIGLQPSVRLLEGSPEALGIALGPPEHDVDGDGVAEQYGKSYREGLFRIVDGVTEPLGPEQGVSVTPDIHSLHFADLDGDGDTELIVGSAEWGTYDVRVLDGDGAGNLRLRARAHRNAVMSVTSLPDPWRPGSALLVTLENHIYSNVVTFGASDPVGPLSAVVIRRLVGDELEEIFSWEIGKSSATLLPHTADLDGDGRTELIVARQGVRTSGRKFDTVIFWTGEEPDTFTRSEIEGVMPHVSLQLDDDPAAEMVVSLMGEGRERPMWILGLGDTPLPSPPPAEPRAPQPMPAGVRGTPNEDVWTALQTLQLAGLLPQAAAALEGLAAVSEDAVSADAASAAAELWAEAQRPDRAATAYELAASRSHDPQEAARAWSLATAAWLDAAAPAKALALSERWSPVGAFAERLGDWQASGEQRVSLIGSRRHPSLQVEEPLSVSESPGHLGVDLFGGTAPVVRLPLERDGPFALDLALEMSRLEWGASAMIGLEAPDGSVQELLTLQLSGGGGVNRTGASCLGLDHPTVEAVPRVGVGDTIRLEVGLTWTEDRGWACMVSMPGEGRASVGTQIDAPPPRSGALVISGGGRVDLHQWIALDLTRLDIWGVTPGPPSDDARHLAAAALLDSNPRRALALAEEGDAISRAIALAQLGQLPQTLDALRAADPAALAERSPYLLRARRETWAPLLRGALGDDFVALFEAVHQAAPLEAGWTQQAMITDLSGLELLERSPELAAKRAIALLRAGRRAQGRQAVEDWLAQNAALGQASGLLRELAVSAAEQGDAEAAVGYARRSVAVARWPELEQDRIAASDGWRALGLPRP